MTIIQNGFYTKKWETQTKDIAALAFSWNWESNFLTLQKYDIQEDGKWKVSTKENILLKDLALDRLEWVLNNALWRWDENLEYPYVISIGGKSTITIKSVSNWQVNFVWYSTPENKRDAWNIPKDWVISYSLDLIEVNDLLNKVKASKVMNSLQYKELVKTNDYYLDSLNENLDSNKEDKFNHLKFSYDTKDWERTRYSPTISYNNTTKNQYWENGYYFNYLSNVWLRDKETKEPSFSMITQEKKGWKIASSNVSLIDTKQLNFIIHFIEDRSWIRPGALTKEEENFLKQKKSLVSLNYKWDQVEQFKLFGDTWAFQVWINLKTKDVTVWRYNKELKRPMMVKEWNTKELLYHLKQIQDFIENPMRWEMSLLENNMNTIQENKEELIKDLWEKDYIQLFVPSLKVLKEDDFKQVHTLPVAWNVDIKINTRHFDDNLLCKENKDSRLIKIQYSDKENKEYIWTGLDISEVTDYLRTGKLEHNLSFTVKNEKGEDVTIERKANIDWNKWFIEANGKKFEFEVNENFRESLKNTIISLTKWELVWWNIKTNMFSFFKENKLDFPKMKENNMNKLS